MIGEWTAPNANWTGYKGENIKLVSKFGATVWNYITQNKAANLCKNLADTNGYEGVTSDLINSYAWDTALVFIQKCGTDSNYANQTGKSTPVDISEAGETILAEGAGAGKNDVQCNIYDMAGNCWEWTTETCSVSNVPCAYRGGFCSNESDSASHRGGINTNYSSSGISFRPLLYL